MQLPPKCRFRAPATPSSIRGEPVVRTGAPPDSTFARKQPPRLRPAIRVMDQAAVALGLACVQRLLERIEHEVRSHRTAHLPAHDAPRKHVDHEGYIQPALPRRDIREVRDPELVWSLGSELPIDLVQRARRLAVADRRSHHLATHHTAQPLPTHQSLDGAARYARAFTAQLPPDLVSTVDLHVGVPDALDLRRQHLIAAHSSATPLRISAKRGMSSIPRRGDLQHLADRLDPVGAAVLVDEAIRI